MLVLICIIILFCLIVFVELLRRMLFLFKVVIFISGCWLYCFIVWRNLESWVLILIGILEISFRVSLLLFSVV